jgi:hypothetical protein
MFGASLALAVIILADSPSADPASLVLQLGSPLYSLREAAEADLARMGRQALPALQAARNSKDPEIRTRASAISSKIEESLLLQPTPVSFDIRDTPLDQAIQAINAQAGLSLALSPEDNPAFRGRRLSLRTNESIPFWKAVDLLCSAAQVHYMQGFSAPPGQRDGVFPLYEGAVPSTEPFADSGPFRVHLSSLHYQSEVHLARPRPNHPGQPNSPGAPNSPGLSQGLQDKQFYLQLTVAAEPRLSVTQNGAVRLTSAVDDRGQSLVLQPRPGTFQHSAGYFGMNPSPLVRLRVDLAHPEAAGKRIRLIRGVIPVVVAARKPDPLEFPIEGSIGKLFRNDEVALTVRESRPSRNNQPATLELSVKPFGPGIPPLDAGEGEPLAYRPDSPQQQIEILDAQGRALPWFPSGTNYNGEETRLILTLISRGKPSIPATIRYHGITRAASEIAFEFRDIPMP